MKKTTLINGEETTVSFLLCKSCKKEWLGTVFHESGATLCPRCKSPFVTEIEEDDDE